MHGDTSKSLLQSIRNGDTDLARRILFARNFTNIDRQSSRKDGTPLFWSCCLGYIDLVHLLLLNGADVNAATAWGATPLHACADRNYVDIVTLLVRFGANVNQQTTQGDTPCHLASYRGFIQCVKRLTDEGADVELRNNKRLTSVEEAYVQGHYDIYRYLVAVQQLVSTNSSMDSIQCLKVNDSTSIKVKDTGIKVKDTSLKANDTGLKVKDTTRLKVKDVPCFSAHSVSEPPSRVVIGHQLPVSPLPVQTGSCSVRSETDGSLSETGLSSFPQESLYSEGSLWSGSELKESNVPHTDRVIGVLRLSKRATTQCDSDSSSSSSDWSCSSLNDLSAGPSTFSTSSGRSSVHKLSFKNI